jgi:catechol 2,3-dioxygenase-like lactoylglutathione lyase family enzyme
MFIEGKGKTMTQRETPQVIGVRHVGLSARDPAALAEFYRDVLGLQVVPVDTATLGAFAFLSSRPAEVPVDLALFANPAYQHTAFEVRSLADLRALHQRVLGRGVPVKMALNHGVSLSFYFDDPEGHQIEVYWPTGVVCRPRHGHPHRPNAPGRSTPAGRGGFGGASGRPVRERRAVVNAATDPEAPLRPVLVPRCGQAWAGKSLENVDKSLILGCDLRKVCEG